uniref:Uncharacterized protein n=1 Tax=Klebsiella pneumoniae TaxID=573 RepID=A0A455TKV9_KLEPN|nr:hypothetical protein [Klebsiella pneumoniae]
MHSSPLKIPTPHAKLKFCRFIIYNNGLMKNKLHYLSLCNIYMNRR